MSFGDSLYTLRKQRQMSRRELGEKLELTSATITAYEQNQYLPRFITAVKIAQIFGASLDDMVGAVALQVEELPPLDGAIMRAVEKMSEEQKRCVLAKAKAMLRKSDDR